MAEWERTRLNRLIHDRDAVIEFEKSHAAIAEKKLTKMKADLLAESTAKRAA